MLGTELYTTCTVQLCVLALSLISFLSNGNQPLSEMEKQIRWTIDLTACGISVSTTLS